MVESGKNIANLMLRPYKHPDLLEAGCDEAGRGCLAGPVFAAAVILPGDFHHPWLNDSKQVTAARRNVLRPLIESSALSYGIGQASPAEIDEMNIRQASLLAMHRALDQLDSIPQCILVDGNYFHSWREIPHHCVVKGDAIFASIAAASVLAKTYRDECMSRLDTQYPEYFWKRNKGYPTLQHREAIRSHGRSPHHRQTFRLLPQQRELPFN